jgi:hypothetical protein
MPTDRIEELLSEEEQRDEWKKRLEQLDQSRQERLRRLDAALRKLSAVIPREGQVPSTMTQEEFADEQMAVHRILEENGLGPALARLAQRMSATSDRNLRVAAALLVEDSTQGILKRLGQIGRRPRQRDPHDPGQVCQSEIFRQYRDLLGQLVKLEDFPEHAESVELQTKLWPSVLPPASPGVTAGPSGDGCAPVAATDPGELETAGPGRAPGPRANGNTGAHFDHWAFGMEAEGRWHLFRRVMEGGRPQWRYQRKVQKLSRGKLQQIMQKLAEGEGFVSRDDLSRLIFRAPLSERSKYKGQVLTPLSRLRAVIRENVACMTKADPLPWDEGQQGWRAKIEIGYATQEESRLKFGTRSAMQP